MTLPTLKSLTDAHLTSESLKKLELIRQTVNVQGFSFLEVHFASLPRKFGRQFLSATKDEVALGMRIVSLRSCDLVAANLLLELTTKEGGSNAHLFKLYSQGDALERRMILKALNFLPVDETTERLLAEAHRTNDEEIFKAAFVDTSLPARMLSDDDYARGVLKCAFMDIELSRLLDAPARANSTMSAMLLEFMTEREAAGRPCWPGSLELAALAPSLGVASRIAGDIFHGDDTKRYHAVRGAGSLIRAGNVGLKKELARRSPLERNARISSEIEKILAS